MFRHLSSSDRNKSNNQSYTYFPNKTDKVCKLYLQSGETAEIEITACALNVGSNNEVLIATIENNDQPLKINVYYQFKFLFLIKKTLTLLTRIFAFQLESTGVELQIEIEPKRLNLGRILHGRIEKHPMTIRNHSAVTIHWHLTTDPEISFVPSYGKVKARASCEIELQYYASKVMTLFLRA